MKATELMVGDWVLDGKKPAQITGIMCDDLFETTLSPSVGGECITPIPLTHEILKKNGFRLQSDRSELGTLDTYWFGSELGGFRIHRLNNGDYQFGLAKIRNVHELQHAMRLCGIEKEVVL